VKRFCTVLLDMELKLKKEGGVWLAGNIPVACLFFLGTFYAFL
jgi:hypothetical protein